jgi:hypothetical protein
MRDAILVYVHLLRAKDLIDRDYAQPLDVSALARGRMPRRRTSGAALGARSGRRRTSTCCGGG